MKKLLSYATVSRAVKQAEKRGARDARKHRIGLRSHYLPLLNTFSILYKYPLYSQWVSAKE